MKKKKFSFPCPHCGGTLDAEMLADIVPQLAGSFRGLRTAAMQGHAEQARAMQKLGQEALKRKREAATPEEREARREQCRQAARARWAAKKAAKEGEV